MFFFFVHYIYLCSSPRVPEEYVGRRNLECVEALQENPLNPKQVLIGYSRGLMVLWDLDRRCAIQHFLGTQVLLHTTWNSSHLHSIRISHIVR